jgi:hypothetical protein
MVEEAWTVEHKMTIRKFLFFIFSVSIFLSQVSPAFCYFAPEFAPKDNLSCCDGANVVHCPMAFVNGNRNGRNLEIELVGFNREQFNQELQQIKHTIFNNATDQGIPEEEAAERIEILGEYAEDAYTEAVEEELSKEEAKTLMKEKVNALNKVSKKIERKIKQEESPAAATVDPNVAGLLHERFIGAQPSAEQAQEAEAYQFLIGKRIEEVSSDPHNDSKLRKLRITIESYAAEYPRLAKLFGQTLEAFGAVATVGGGYAMTVGILAAAGTTVGATPALVSATVFGAATYLVHKAGESLGETINYAAMKAAEWSTNDPHERAELTSDYSLGGMIFLALGGLPIKGGGKNFVDGKYKTPFKKVEVPHEMQQASGLLAQQVERAVEWTAPTGTKQTYTIFQRTDIDWNLVRNNPKGPKKCIGKTNLEAALSGYAPELADGSIVNLHHAKREKIEPLWEMSAKEHQTNPALHADKPIDPVDRLLFNQERPQYWIDRALDVKNGK